MIINDSISYIEAAKTDSISMGDSIKDALLSIPQFGDEPLAGKHHSLFEQIGQLGADIGHDGIPLPFTIEQADGVFGLLLICFLFFAYIYDGGLLSIKENVSLFLSSGQNRRINPQTTVKEIVYSYFLIFQAIVLISICIYDVLLEYGPSIALGEHRPLITILSFIILIFLFLLIRNIIYRLLGYIFEIESSIAVWCRIYAVSIEILGMVYFIPTLLLIYNSYFHTEIVVLMLILFLIVRITLFYQIIIFFIKEKFNFLYLIAYLCTFEILPYIFLLIGLNYLYRIDVLDILWP